MTINMVPPSLPLAVCHRRRPSGGFHSGQGTARSTATSPWQTQSWPWQFAVGALLLVVLASLPALPTAYRRVLQDGAVQMSSLSSATAVSALQAEVRQQQAAAANVDPLRINGAFTAGETAFLVEAFSGSSGGGSMEGSQAGDQWPESVKRLDLSAASRWKGSLPMLVLVTPGKVPNDPKVMGRLLISQCSQAGANEGGMCSEGSCSQDGHQECRMDLPCSDALASYVKATLLGELSSIKDDWLDICNERCHVYCIQPLHAVSCSCPPDHADKGGNSSSLGQRCCLGSTVAAARSCSLPLDADLRVRVELRGRSSQKQDKKSYSLVSTASPASCDSRGCRHGVARRTRHACHEVDCSCRCKGDSVGQSCVGMRHV